MNHDRTKLPKWAQDELDTLERERDYWRARATLGPDESDTFVSWDGKDKPLGFGPTIKFQTGERTYVEAYLSDDQDGWFLRVHSNDMIAVHPHAQNSVHIRRGR